MAKTKNAVVKVEKPTSLVTQEAPSYLKGTEKMGTEALGRGDFKIPRIKLLQPLSPEIRSFQGKAIPGEFWHTGVNQSLGSEFLMVPAIVNKRVVVWRHRDDNDGGILAYSKDGINWATGGNQTFKVKLPGKKELVEWKTGKNVQQSGLLEFGTSDVEDQQSPPAATVAYEYLCYLPEHPEFSPVVLGVSKTGVGNARAFNTYILGTHKPSSCIVARCFADEESKGKNTWHVPKFDPHGWASEEVFKVAEAIKGTHAEYESVIENEEVLKEDVSNVKDY